MTATQTCNRSTLKGGAGVNDASGIRTYWCDRTVDHPGVCNYTRVSTEEGGAKDLRTRVAAETDDLLARILDGRSDAREADIPAKPLCVLLTRGEAMLLAGSGLLRVARGGERYIYDMRILLRDVDIVVPKGNA